MTSGNSRSLDDPAGPISNGRAYFTVSVRDSVFVLSDRPGATDATIFESHSRKNIKARVSFIPLYQLRRNENGFKYQENVGI
jgi:hypothetical protein